MIIKLYSLDLYNNLDNLIKYRLKHFGNNYTINNTNNNIYIGFYKNYTLIFKLINNDFNLRFIGVNDLYANTQFYFTDILGDIDRIYDFYNKSRIIITNQGNIWYEKTNECNPISEIIVGKLQHSNYQVNIEKLLQNRIDIIYNNNFPKQLNYKIIFE
jgi:hypothetical protein